MIEPPSIEALYAWARDEQAKRWAAEDKLIEARSALAYKEQEIERMMQENVKPLPRHMDQEHDAGAAGRAWFASEAWQESEMNYLADFKIEPDVMDAFEEALIQAFYAGAEWRQREITLLRADLKAAMDEGQRCQKLLGEWAAERKKGQG